MGSKIAYFINQYPMVSHSFIRREIQALERHGLEVLRIAARGWDAELVDAEDTAERTRTHYLLQRGAGSLAWAVVRTLALSPRRFFAALVLALRAARSSDRGVLYHLVYLSEACRMLSWLRAFGASHLHAHFATNSAEVAMLARALGGPPYSFTAHGTADFDRLQSLGIRHKVQTAAFVVAVSSHGRSQLYRAIEHSLWSRVKVVHCGLEPAFYSVKPTPPPSAPRLVCVGRLAEEKGQLLLVEAAGRLAEKGIRLQLVLAGDGPLRNRLQALIGELNLEGQVRITGWISGARVREEILAARALILPSFSEGLPVVLMEAMALRRPVLATYVGGIPELVRPGKDGWLFPAGCPDALARALQEVVACSPDELARMGESAHQRALERHSIDRSATQLARLFSTP